MAVVTGYPPKTQLQLKSNKTLNANNFLHIYPIILKFCSEHGSGTAMSHAKLQNVWASEVGVMLLFEMGFAGISYIETASIGQVDGIWSSANMLVNIWIYIAQLTMGPQIGCNILILHCYTPVSTKLKGGYTGFTLSVCLSVRPSVRLSVCGQNHVHSIYSTILVGSIWYLKFWQIL